MTEPNLEPTPRGWLDKVCDSGAFSILAAMVILLFALEPLSDRVGYWPALAIIISAGIAFAILISLPFVRRQKQRAGLDAEQGLFACIDNGRKRTIADVPSGTHRPKLVVTSRPPTSSGTLPAVPGGTSMKPRLSGFLGELR